VSAIVVALDQRGDHLDGSVMRNALGAAHDRGPDGRGYWQDGPITLASQSLALLPGQVGELQPVLVDEFVGVFDGRLDNAVGLKSLLGLREPPDGVSDAELAIRAFARWGDDAPKHLMGDFGFAVWDRTRRRLFCARDQLGVRPIYYASAGNVLVIATDIRAVLAHPNLSLAPNLRHVSDLLVSRLRNHTDTPYEGVMRLAPAHTLCAERGRVAVHKYWDFESVSETLPAGSENCVEAFLAVFGEAVRSRLRARTAPTVALSGGLDSSLVAAVAMDYLNDKSSDPDGLTTTSLVFPGLDCDESTYIDAVNVALNLQGRPIQWTPVDWDGILEAANRAQYLPPDPNATYDMFVRAGLRRCVVLTGSGGDQLMSGYEAYLRDLWRTGAYRRLAVAAQHVGWREFARTAITSARARVGLPITPSSARSRAAILGPALEVHGRASESGHVASADTGPPGSIVRRQRFASITSTWDAHALEVTDRWAQEGSLSLVHPFYDRRVVEFALNLSDAARWEHGDYRALSRRALARRVPLFVTQRATKAEFTPPVRAQIEAIHAHRVLDESLVVAAGWISKDLLPALHAAIDDPGERRPSIRSVWPVVAVEAWVRAMAIDVC
jgi:asparagine synthase (glutamine-hydrolysing)